MTSLWGDKPYTFHALRKTFGLLYVTCSTCRRFMHLAIGELRDVDYRTKTFSCSVCGAAGYLAISDPRTETGLEDFRLDQREQPQRHPHAVDRLTRPRRRIDFSNRGELPGRKVDPRR